MTNKQIQTVQSTWALVADIDPIIVGYLFYNRLFEIAPELKPLFKSSIQSQSKKLLMMIGYVINKLDSLDDIIDEVGSLAKRHVAYNVRPEHYAVVGQALLWTLEKGLGDNWNAETAEAWSVCYNILSEAMIEAAGYEEKDVA